MGEGSTTARHNIVRDLMMGMIDTCIEKEYRVLHPEPDVTHYQMVNYPQTRRADLEFRDIVMDFHVTIDFVVSEVAAREFINNVEGSHTTADYANDKNEEKKKVKYKMFTPAFLSEFVPFAVESTGRIGKAGHQLLDVLAKRTSCSPTLVNLLKRDISIELLKFRADRVISNRKMLQIAPVNRRSVSRINLPPAADHPLIVANQAEGIDMTVESWPLSLYSA
jgi:hypothetical protein